MAGSWLVPGGFGAGPWSIPGSSWLASSWLMVFNGRFVPSSLFGKADADAALQGLEAEPEATDTDAAMPGQLHVSALVH